VQSEDLMQFDIKKRFAVVIVGAGPTGLVTANLLGLAGIDTLLLERNADLSIYPKAISIDDEGLRICQALGLRDTILADTLLDIDAYYLSGKHYLACVSPSGRRNGYPLISTFHQPTFERSLYNGLRRFSCVEVCFRHELEAFEQYEQGVRLSVRAPSGVLQEIECAYLLACDGGRSMVRRALGIALHSPLTFRKKKREQRRIIERSQRWLVVDCINDDDPVAAATFFCNPARPAVSVSAPGNGRRWEFMLLPGENEEDLLNADTIYALIKQTQATRHRNQSGKLTQIVRYAVYTFHAVLAEQFSRGRVFLLGDAAHLMPPFGGQGMNSGLRDAHNLCWKLQMVLQGRAPQSVLKSYTQERSPHVAQMILFSSFLGMVIMPTKRSLALLRDFFFRGIVNHILPIRRALEEMRVKPQPRYTKGLLLPGGGRENRRLRGKYLPQPFVLTQAGERVLLDDILGNGFVLLCFGSEPEEMLILLRATPLWKRLGVRFVCVLPPNALAKKQDATSDHVGREMDYLYVVDVEGVLGAFLQHRKNLYVLVRPDHYIMGAFQAQEVEKVVQQLCLFSGDGLDIPPASAEKMVQLSEH
jgi:3-(3-hydroxy-phenyl)propionate hydroxylase